MSWQVYVDTNLLASGQVTAAGIYDMQGNPWAYSAGFAAQIAEVAAVSAHMHTGDPSGLAGTGVVVAGVKYMFVSGSGDEVYGKKGNEGVVFCKCASPETAPAALARRRRHPADARNHHWRPHALQPPLSS